MCMACEETEMFYRWQMLQQIASGQMPPGMTEDDLRAMEMPLPGEIEIVTEADGTTVLKRKETAARKPAPANAFVCDVPDDE